MFILPLNCKLTHSNVHIYILSHHPMDSYPTQHTLYGKVTQHHTILETESRFSNLTQYCRSPIHIWWRSSYLEFSHCLVCNHGSPEDVSKFHINTSTFLSTISMSHEPYDLHDPNCTTYMYEPLYHVLILHCTVSCDLLLSTHTCTACGLMEALWNRYMIVHVWYITHTLIPSYPHTPIPYLSIP